MVAGATGFIGRRLVGHLRRAGIVVDAWAREGVPDPVDLSDSRSVKERLAHFHPDVVFHLAAAGARHVLAHDPRVIGINVEMVANVVAAARESAPAARLVLAGSMAEYGDSACPLAEDAPCTPTTAYGIGKLAATRYALAYGPAAGLSVSVARLFGVYGPGEDPERLFPSLLGRLQERKPVNLSDGRQQRDFVHVDDACECLIRLARGNRVAAEVVNICTGEALAVRDIATWFAAAVGADPALLLFGTLPRSPGDSDVLVGDPTRLKARAGWTPPQRMAPGANFLRLLQEGL